MAVAPDSRTNGGSLSHRVGSLAFMGAAIVAGAVYIGVARTYDNGQSLGPATFPTLLGILLIASSLVGAVVAIREDDRRVPLGDLTGVAVAIGITATYLVLWNLTGWFYPATFVFLVALTTFLRGSKPRTRTVVIDVVASAAITGFVVLFFGELLGVGF